MQENMENCWPDDSGPGQSPVAGSCEHSNEHTGYM
jgi:hypothetical protein